MPPCHYTPPQRTLRLNGFGNNADRPHHLQMLAVFQHPHTLGAFTVGRTLPPLPPLGA